MVHIFTKNEFSFEVVYDINYGEKGTAYPENKPEIKNIYVHHPDQAYCNLDMVSFIEDEAPLFFAEIDETLYEKHRYDTK